MLSPDDLISMYASKIGVVIREYDARQVKQQTKRIIDEAGSENRDICRGHVSDWYINDRSGYKANEVRLWIATDVNDTIVGFLIVAPRIIKRNIGISKFGNVQLDNGKHIYRSELIAVCAKGAGKNGPGLGSLLILIGLATNERGGQVLEVGYHTMLNEKDEYIRVFSPSAFNAYRKFGFRVLKSVQHRGDEDKYRMFMYRTGGVSERFAKKIMYKNYPDDLRRIKPKKFKRVPAPAVNMDTGKTYRSSQSLKLKEISDED